ncbi:MAG: hypothetical protein RLP15_07190 [Cryomorphaceae bacterium]
MLRKNLIKLSWLTVLFVFVSVGATIAQNWDKSRTDELIITNTSGTIRFEVHRSAGRKNLRDSKQYTWFKSNELHSTYGGYSGYLLHGEYKEFYLDRGLRSSGAYRRGLKTGKWLHWHANGRIERREKYRNGQLDGEVSKYDENGVLQETIAFRRGQRHGKTIRYIGEEKVGLDVYRAGILISEGYQDDSVRVDRDETIETVESPDTHSSSKPRSERKRLKSLIK